MLRATGLRYALVQMPEQSRWQWTEVNPHGHPIHCSEARWQHVLTDHPDMDGYELAVRLTIRGPDAVYLDPRGTSFTYNPAAWVVVHIARGHTHGYYAGRLINVVIRWEPHPTAPPTGYVITAYLSRRVSGRLQLQEEFGS